MTAPRRYRKIAPRGCDPDGYGLGGRRGVNGAAHGAAEHRTQMFGLFALSGHSQRAGMATILVFLLAGLLLLIKVPEPARQ